MKTKGICRSLTVASTILCMTGCPSIKTSRKANDAAPVTAEQNAPAPPAGLVCTTNLLDVFLAWSNSGDYSEIRITRGGVLRATLDGAAVSFSEAVSAPGTYAYEVIGAGDTGLASAPASCSVAASALPPVAGLTGTFDARANEVRLSWRLPAGVRYDGVRVFRNSVVVAQLSGAATSCTDPTAPVGSCRYQVCGVLQGRMSEAAVCTVQVTALGGITGLTWSVDSGTGDILLAWRNGQTYDAIAVCCGGEEIAVLAGNTAQYRYNHVPCGVYEFSVQGSYGERSTAVARCEGNVGRVVWDADSVGNVAGYHVYVWAEGRPVPSQPSHTVQRVTTMPLLELLNGGALPMSREPAGFQLALAAFDAYGNTSDLSESVAFAWQVLSTSNLD
ncbi:MAG TPA: hypothetical protein PKX48_02550 [Planctomycetota bacterium]|jgi:hypothetical protein|nr:hypothetical protein [Planctomycetota bacterium]OQC19921.1 MAG: hypothetical protein BWX69_02311 [Planctomycetes bacterium ADurb.Bin069]NMD35068.1 hypothetical protein [Planctomycetota bacterium]HNR99829.1 hypothetical protein [Planctomycetota bacterium]HNU26302.1 hypothetical protein [Planctomycetota bacterium]